MLSRDDQHKAILTILEQNTEVDLDRWESNCLASVLLDHGVSYEPPTDPEPLSVGTTVSDGVDVWARVGYDTDKPWLVISNNSGHQTTWAEILEYAQEEGSEIHVDAKV